MKLETSPKVIKPKRSLHWCRLISKHLSVQVLLGLQYRCISKKVITLSGWRFITVSGVFITLSGTYYIIWHLLHYRAFLYYISGQVLQYRAFITLSVGTPHMEQTRPRNYCYSQPYSCICKTESLLMPSTY